MNIIYMLGEISMVSDNIKVLISDDSVLARKQLKDACNALGSTL